MILDQLHLKNFGAFRDPAPIILKPSSLDRPVVLVGALNGSGKTTILEALQLVLYGKRSRSARSYQGGYADYLRTLMHRAAPPSEGTEIVLSFLTGDMRKPQHYEVRRQWNSRSGRLSETLDVFENGERNELLSSNWAREVERFIPLNLSELFFFDGEKIEGLADPESSSRILQTAINSLLGADLIDQLTTDLEVLRRQKARSVSDKKQNKEIIELEASAASFQEQLSTIRDASAGLRSALAGAKAELERAEAKYALRGGQEFEQRAKLHGIRESLSSTICEVQEQLQELATSALPLSLISEQLRATSKQATTERELSRNKTLSEQLSERDHSLIKWVSTHNVGTAFQTKLISYLQQDRDRLAPRIDVSAWLELPESESGKISSLLEVTLPAERERVRHLSNRLSDLLSQKLEAEQKIARIPPAEALKDVIESIGRGRERVAELEKQLARAKEEEKDASYRLEVLNRRISREASANNLAMLLSAHDHRTVAYSEKVSLALEQFRRMLIKHHVSSLEEAITEAFALLWRKKTKSVLVRINPDTFELRLENPMGGSIPTNRLSAGERQLLAVAILWGLAKASGRPLPVVIDTPLGRLDGTHRRHLLTRYFPDASHQVILLSTDTEITGKARDSMEDVIAHSYTLRYREDMSATTVERGYFQEAS